MNREHMYNSPCGPTGLAPVGAADPDIALGAFVYKIDSEIFTVDVNAGTSLDPVTVADGTKQGITVLIDTAGALSYELGNTIVRTLNYKLSDFAAADKDKAVVGYILVDNDSGADWVAGTDDLDATDVTVTMIDAFGVIGM